MRYMKIAVIVAIIIGFISAYIQGHSPGSAQRRVEKFVEEANKALPKDLEKLRIVKMELSDNTLRMTAVLFPRYRINDENLRELKKQETEDYCTGKMKFIADAKVTLQIIYMDEPHSLGAQTPDYVATYSPDQCI